MGLFDILWKDPNEGKTNSNESEKEIKPSTKTIPPTNIGKIGQTFNALQSETTDSISSSNAGTKKQEIVDYFKKVFEESNFPGPDYQEFAIALDEMKSLPMDEATKIKTIFMSFKAMKQTPEKIIETAEQYKGLFKSKIEQFDSELDEAYAQSVGKMLDAADSIKKKNAEIDAEMIKLNEQKLDNEKTFKDLEEKIQEKTTDLNTRKNDWHVTYDSVIAEIDGNIALVRKHLIQ